MDGDPLTAPRLEECSTLDPPDFNLAEVKIPKRKSKSAKTINNKQPRARSAACSSADQFYAPDSGPISTASRVYYLPACRSTFYAGRSAHHLLGSGLDERQRVMDSETAAAIHNAADILRLYDIATASRHSSTITIRPIPLDSDRQEPVVDTSAPLEVSAIDATTLSKSSTESLDRTQPTIADILLGPGATTLSYKHPRRRTLVPRQERLVLVRPCSEIASARSLLLERRRRLRSASSPESRHGDSDLFWLGGQYADPRAIARLSFLEVLILDDQDRLLHGRAPSVSTIGELPDSTLATAAPRRQTNSAKPHFVSADRLRLSLSFTSAASETSTLDAGEDGGATSFAEVSEEVRSRPVLVRLESAPWELDGDAEATRAADRDNDVGPTRTPSPLLFNTFRKSTRLVPFWSPDSITATTTTTTTTTSQTGDKMQQPKARKPLGSIDMNRRPPIEAAADAPAGKTKAKLFSGGRRSLMAVFRRVSSLTSGHNHSNSNSSSNTRRPVDGDDDDERNAYSPTLRSTEDEASQRAQSPLDAEIMRAESVALGARLTSASRVTLPLGPVIAADGAAASSALSNGGVKRGGVTFSPSTLDRLDSAAIAASVNDTVRPIASASHAFPLSPPLASGELTPALTFTSVTPAATSPLFLSGGGVGVSPGQSPELGSSSLPGAGSLLLQPLQRPLLSKLEKRKTILEMERAFAFDDLNPAYLELGVEHPSHTVYDEGTVNGGAGSRRPVSSMYTIAHGLGLGIGIGNTPTKSPASAAEKKTPNYLADVSIPAFGAPHSARNAASSAESDGSGGGSGGSDSDAATSEEVADDIDDESYDTFAAGLAAPLGCHTRSGAGAARNGGGGRKGGAGRWEDINEFLRLGPIVQSQQNLASFASSGTGFAGGAGTGIVGGGRPRKSRGRQSDDDRLSRMFDHIRIDP